MKIAKPRQELRVDLPTIGPQTVERAFEAGLAGMIVEGGRTLILKRARTIADADMRRLFIHAVTEGAEA